MARAFPAGYRLPRKREFWDLRFMLWQRRHNQLNKKLKRLTDEGPWPRNPVWRRTYDPLRPQMYLFLTCRPQ